MPGECANHYTAGCTTVQGGVEVARLELEYSLLKLTGEQILIGVFNPLFLAGLLSLCLVNLRHSVVVTPN